MSLTERLLVFDRDFLEDLAFWVSTDRKVALKILELVGARPESRILFFGNYLKSKKSWV